MEQPAPKSPLSQLPCRGPFPGLCRGEALRKSASATLCAAGSSCGPLIRGRSAAFRPRPLPYRGCAMPSRQQQQQQQQRALMRLISLFGTFLVPCVDDDNATAASGFAFHGACSKLFFSPTPPSGDGFVLTDHHTAAGISLLSHRLWRHLCTWCTKKSILYVFPGYVHVTLLLFRMLTISRPVPKLDRLLGQSSAPIHSCAKETPETVAYHQLKKKGRGTPLDTRRRPRGEYAALWGRGGDAGLQVRE